LTFDVVDDSIPAIVKTNLFLTQLATTNVPSLIGRLALRLDDVHQPAITADVILNLGFTGGGDDLVIVIADDGMARLSNPSPLDLLLTRATFTGSGFTTQPINQQLASAATTTLALPDDARDVLVDRTLAVPLRVGADQMGRYLTITTTSVQQVHVVLGFNVSGQLTPLGIAKVVVTTSVDNAPTITVPTITLTPQHEVDNTAVAEIPAAFALQGMVATLSLAISYVDQTRPPIITTVSHDFLEQPIATITADQLDLPSPTN
jgi:hypothetical protein